MFNICGLVLFAASVTLLSSGDATTFSSGIITLHSIGSMPSHIRVPFPFSPSIVTGGSGSVRKLADGTIVKDCFDWRYGMRAHMEEWVESNSWKIVCKNGTSTVTGCVGTRRIGFAVLNIGETKEENGFWHKCERLEDQALIKYSQEPSCVIVGNEFHINDTFRNGAFKMKCEKWGYSIAGCYFYDDEGNVKELELNGAVDVGIMRHHCDPDPDVQGRVKYHVHATACKKDDKIYQVNETWTTGSLKYKCLENGAFTVLGCITPKGRELAVGEDYIENNTVVHRCYRIGRTTYYHSYACGVMGVSCQLKPLPFTSGSVVSVSGAASVGSRTTPELRAGNSAAVQLKTAQPMSLSFGSASMSHNARTIAEKLSG